MKIIDFEKKGNLVRFWLGDDDCKDYWGDDFGDVPYEHNAGRVYENFIKGYKDVCFPFEWAVAEPCDGVLNSGYSKEDMKYCQVPCIAAVDNIGDWDDSFAHIVAKKNAQTFYFGDKLEPDMLCEYDAENYDLKYIPIDKKE